MTRPLLLFSLLAASAACVPAPKQIYTLDQLAKLESLKELMRVQAKAMDPLFAKRSQASFSDSELGSMSTAARQIEATASALQLRFSTRHAADFRGFADQLGKGAKDLLAAAEGKLAPRAAVALQTMRQVCASCHKAYK